ncbi:MAG: hypothetical protein CMH28_02460 [Micavibrio sp.]|nr:hypothetical protein [Micavibrio sp.]|tara:strand:+ start:405 stop:827 length:423 start_codon:yes stop_codon:yes gene_type:complete
MRKAPKFDQVGFGSLGWCFQQVRLKVALKDKQSLSYNELKTLWCISLGMQLGKSQGKEGMNFWETYKVMAAFNCLINYQSLNGALEALLEKGMIETGSTKRKYKISVKGKIALRNIQLMMIQLQNSSLDKAVTDLKKGNG